MSLISIEFFIFLIIFLILFFIVPKKYGWLLVLISSLIFIFYSDHSIINIVEYLIVLLSGYFSTILATKTKKNIFYILGILIILAELIFLKYTNLILTISNDLFSTSFDMVSRTSPMGLSYFSLIMIGYIVDTKRKVNDANKNILKLGTFMTYFPILTSGPFINYSSIDLYSEKKFSKDNFYKGLIRILLGIFKVLVISNRISIYVDSIYSNLSDYNGIYVLIAILTYVFQLYTNFSGSIDIIIGVSKIIGIELPENFENPFLSTSITELWRRWHITLGAWLKNYLFYPLLKSNFIQKLMDKSKKAFGNKVGKKLVTYLCMLILWVTIGAWHSGMYKFIFSSGILQLVYMIFEDLLFPIMKKKVNTESKTCKILSRIRVWILFSLAMVFFRADSITNGFEILSSVFNNASQTIFDTGIVLSDIIILISCLILMFIFEYKREDNIEKFNKLSSEKKIAICLSLVLFIIVFGVYGIGFNAEDFIYSKF